MVVEKLSCPICGKMTEIATPTGTEITQIKKKSVWNKIVSSSYGTQMATICEHCHSPITIWFKKPKKGSRFRV